MEENLGDLIFTIDFSSLGALLSLHLDAKVVEEDETPPPLGGIKDGGIGLFFVSVLFRSSFVKNLLLSLTSSR